MGDFTILEIDGTLKKIEEYHDTKTGQKVQVIYYTDNKNRSRKIALDSSNTLELERIPM